MGQAKPSLRSQRLRLVNHQGDALRLGMNWTEEDLGKTAGPGGQRLRHGPPGDVSLPGA